MTNAMIIAKLRIQAAQWKTERRRVIIIGMICFIAICTSIQNLAFPSFISPFQHILTGMLIGASLVKVPWRICSVRSLWTLQSLTLAEAAIARASIMHAGDREFVVNFNDSLPNLAIGGNEAYREHLATIIKALPHVSRNVQPMLNSHMTLFTHGIPRNRWAPWKK